MTMSLLGFGFVCHFFSRCCILYAHHEHLRWNQALQCWSPELSSIGCEPFLFCSLRPSNKKLWCGCTFTQAPNHLDLRAEPSVILLNLSPERERERDLWLLVFSAVCLVFHTTWNVDNVPSRWNNETIRSTCPATGVLVHAPLASGF